MKATEKSPQQIINECIESGDILEAVQKHSNEFLVEKDYTYASLSGNLIAVLYHAIEEIERLRK
ncbi:MAG: hypothetical protein KAR20_00500 [Candidatus Heimdallarchaeota archaeon]|nr:hypothetical protein [Candidatus Heimdallarchaeota archaeon]